MLTSTKLKSATKEASFFTIIYKQTPFSIKFLSFALFIHCFLFYLQIIYVGVVRFHYSQFSL